MFIPTATIIRFYHVTNIVTGSLDYDVDVCLCVCVWPLFCLPHLVPLVQKYSDHKELQYSSMLSQAYNGLCPAYGSMGNWWAAGTAETMAKSIITSNSNSIMTLQWPQAWAACLKDSQSFSGCLLGRECSAHSGQVPTIVECTRARLSIRNSNMVYNFFYK